MKTYIILVPHNVEEGVEWQVEVSAAEASKGSEDGSSQEHAVQMLLGIGQQLLHFLSVDLLTHCVCICASFFFKTL